MIPYDRLRQIALDIGFSTCVPLDPATIILKPEVREMCAGNSCGQYGKRWSCPPGCGTLDACSDQIKEYVYGVLVQTVGDIEDSFDFEAMIGIEAEHKAHFKDMFSALRSEVADILALGTGCCTQCTSCSYPHAPCRFPEQKISSMEAYGMLVLEVCKANDLPYYYGSGKMAYTSCFLLR